MWTEVHTLFRHFAHFVKIERKSCNHYCQICDFVNNAHDVYFQCTNQNRVNHWYDWVCLFSE